jgi:hypothetical protein
MEFSFSELITNSKIWRNDLVDFTANRINFDKFKAGGLHEKQAVAPWNLETVSAFALGPRKTTESLDRVGRSQDLPDAHRLLASSPANRFPIVSLA